MDRILSLYTDEAVFRSKKALTYVGAGETYDKEGLRAYWQAALNAQPDLKFEVQHVFGGYKLIVIMFNNHKNQLAAETLHFCDDGLVERASCSEQDYHFAPLYKLQVDLWVKQGKEEAFLEYEQKEIVNMANYGGTFINRSYHDFDPHERHVLAFPSKTAFEAYRRVPETLAAKIKEMPA